MQAIGARGRLQTTEDYRQTERIKGRLHSHGTHAQRYDTHAETDWGRLITHDRQERKRPHDTASCLISTPSSLPSTMLLLKEDSVINGDKHVSLREALKCTASGGQGFAKCNCVALQKKCGNLNVNALKLS